MKLIKPYEADTAGGGRGLNNALDSTAISRSNTTSIRATNLDVQLEAEEGLDGGGSLGALSVEGAPQLAREHAADGRVLQLRRARHLTAVLTDDRLGKAIVGYGINQNKRQVTPAGHMNLTTLLRTGF